MCDSSFEASDGEAIAAVLAGRRDRFSLIVGRYQAALMRVARSRLGRTDWAEDVVQETFLCAFKSLHSYDSRYGFRTWLWTILLNQCRRHNKRRARRPQVGLLGDEASEARHPESNASALRSGPEATPLAQVMAKERGEVLDRHLAALPAVQADALRLRFFADLKFQEIADAMGCSLSSAKNRVRRGLIGMSRSMDPDGELAPDGERALQGDRALQERDQDDSKNRDVSGAKRKSAAGSGREQLR